MTLPQGTEVRKQYPGNSGAPAEVVGISESGGATVNPYEPLFGGMLATIISYYGTAYNTGGFTNLYVDPSLGTATPIGTISEKTKSPEQIAFEIRKGRLVQAIKAMRKSAPNWYGASTHVNELSAQSAEKFLESLPGNALLPRVAPDGEGDILFVWDSPGQPSCVVTVEKRSLHLACGLGSPQVQHVDEQRFLGVQIPRAILERIPSK